MGNLPRDHFGGLWWVQALQKSVKQQFQPARAQLSSVVQPFSPLSVEEDSRYDVETIEEETNSSEFPGDPTVRCPQKQVEKAGAPNRRTGFQNGDRRENAVPSGVPIRRKNAAQWKGIIFVPNLRMPHLGCSRPVWCRSCSPAACP